MARSLALLLVVQLQRPVQDLICPFIVIRPEFCLHGVGDAWQGLFEPAVQLTSFLLLCFFLLCEHDRHRLSRLFLPYPLEVLRYDVLMPFLFLGPSIDLMEPGDLRL